MRLSGLAASLATFALLIIVHVVAQNLDEVTNGAVGHDRRSLTTTSREAALVWALIAMVGASSLSRVALGLRLRASREDEVAARASGVGVYTERRAAWILSAFIMGIGGALYGQCWARSTPSAFYFNLT